MRETDVVVVGSGIAGLSFALRLAATARVLLVTKQAGAESSTNYAQGGIAAVMDPEDSYHLHVQDTLVAGAGLCRRRAVDILVREGPARVRDLIESGVRFTLDGATLSLGREGGHSRRRIVRSDDLTGREIERALLAAVAAQPNVEVLENHFALDLLLAPDPESGRRRCCGLTVFAEPAGRAFPALAAAVVLATGGCGQVFRHTTNPSVATGDGVAMAWRAGACVANMEFIQFHPTALYPAEQRSFLISEAVRGEGAVLRRRDGNEFMARYHPLASLAPRDVVARAIDAEMKASGDPFVWLDCSAIAPDEIRARFPNILRETAARGVEMLREPLPVVPAAHYSCGGVLTDDRARTSVAGLYAAGEAACTGVHGANRLASNSLLEATVFAERGADYLRSVLPNLPRLKPAAPTAQSQTAPATDAIARCRAALRAVMWDGVGIVRSDAHLKFAERQIEEIAVAAAGLWDDHLPTVATAELRNLVDTARLVVRCARRRRESRGLHYNADFPFRDNEHFLRDTIVSD